MKQKYFFRIVFCFLLISNISYGQLVTTIDFETENSGYTPSATEGSTFTDVFNRIDRTGSPLGGNSTFLFAIEDLNTVTNPSIDLDQIDVSGSDSFTFSIDMLAHHYDDWDNSDELLITYSVDGGTYQNLIWVQNTGQQFNDPAALDLDFNGDGDCGANTTLPSITKGTGTDGCVVSSNNFATFVTNSITLTNKSTLDIKLQFNGFTAGDEGMYFDNIIITETAASLNQTVTFDSTTSSETETDETFATSGIPITLTNYAADVTVTAAVNVSSTAEVGDYTIDLTPLVFDANETLTIPLDINDDADFDDETIVIDIAVTSGTADLGTSTHTVTITDDELPQIMISEIMYNTPSTDDEWIEIYNGNGADLDISNWTVEYSGGTFTFPGSTTITDGDYLTIALGSNGDGTYNNDNPFTPDFNNLSGSPSNANVKDTNDTNKLGNSSGTITLKNSSDTSIDSVDYDDGDASSTDGGGPSYEILDTTSDNSDTVSNWQASALNGGSPGKLNSTTWSGATDSDWNTSSNWSNGIPVSTSDLLIPASLTNYPTTSGAVTVNSVTINSGASLIAQASFNGTVTYKRFLTAAFANDAEGWHLVASPVSGETYDNAYADDMNLATSTTNTSLRGLGFYATADDTWSYLVNDDSNADTFNSGTGYTMKTDSNGEVKFTGNLNTDDLGVDATISSAGNGFNLLGSPYTSFVNSATFLGDNSSLDQQIWVWEMTNGGNYIVKVLADNFEIAPGQGFFVKANSGTSVNFAESNQSAQGTDTFLRTNSWTEVKLLMTDGEKNRFTKLYFTDNASTGFDAGWEGEVFGGIQNEIDVFTHLVEESQGKKYQVQSLPLSDLESSIIPVGVTVEAGKTATFSIENTNVPSNINVYIEDKQDNSFTLLEEDANFSFTPENNLDGIGRFYIHTTTSSLSADDFGFNNTLSIYTSSRENLRVVGVQNGTANIQLYNILGKEVLKSSFEGNGVNDIALPKLNSGVYIVKIATETGTTNKKIIIQ